MVGAGRGRRASTRRYGSPTVRDFEDAVAELEGAEAALAFASGMGAVSAPWSSGCARRATTSSPSARSSPSPTRCSRCTCPRFGIDVTFVDGTDAGAIAAAVCPGKTQLVFAETPANPALSLVDLDALGAIAGPITVVDSTFAGPIGAAAARPRRRPRAPLRHQGHRRPQRRHARRGRRQRRADRRRSGRRSPRMGAQASPFDALNGIRGIRTLAGARRASSPRRRSQLAAFLEAHPAVASVSYPDLAEPPAARPGQAPDDAPAARWSPSRWPAAPTPPIAFVERCRLARIALSLGGPETLVTHPATIAGRYTPAERAELGIADGLVRMSVGLEHPDDLQADLAQALALPQPLPSPILPVRAVSEMRSVTASTSPESTITSIFTLGTKSIWYSAPGGSPSCRPGGRSPAAAPRTSA